MSTETATGVLCQDIEAVWRRDENATLQKSRGQSDYALFTAWIRNEARKHCKGGFCSKGNCHGHANVSKWEVVAEDDTSFTCKFTAELFCRCD